MVSICNLVLALPHKKGVQLAVGWHLNFKVRAGSPAAHVSAQQGVAKVDANESCAAQALSVHCKSIANGGNGFVPHACSRLFLCRRCLACLVLLFEVMQLAAVT